MLFVKSPYAFLYILFLCVWKTKLWSWMKWNFQLSPHEKNFQCVLDKVLEKHSMTNGLGNENVKFLIIFLEIVPFM